MIPKPKRFAVGFVVADAVEIDICPFCSAAHSHFAPGASGYWLGHFRPDCNAARGARYTVANGDMMTRREII